MSTSTGVRHSTPSSPPVEASGAPTAELARGGVLSLGGSITGAAMGLALVVALGRLLGDAGAGTVLQAIAIFTIALGVARCGMDSTALWLLPRLRDDAPFAVRRAVALMLGVAAAAGVVCAASLQLISVTLLPDQDGLGDAVAATAWGLPFAAVMLTALGACRALGGIRGYVLVGNVALPVSRVVVVATVVALAGTSASAVAGAWALVLVPATLAALGLLARHLPAGTARPTAETEVRPLLRTILGFGLPRIVAAVLEQLLLWLDVVIVGILAGPAAAGVYGTVSRLVMAGMVVDSAVRVVVSPWFSRLSHRGDLPALGEVFRTATSWLVLFSTPIYVVLACFAPLPLSLVGDEFTSGATALAVLCVGAVVTFLAGNVHSLLLMCGRSGLAALNKVVAVTINLALLLLLVPPYGVTGAAIAWALATLADALIAAVQVRTLLRLPVPVSAGLYPLGVALAACGLPALVCRALFGATWWSLGTALLIGLIALLAWTRRSRARLHLDELAALTRRPAKGTS